MSKHGGEWYVAERRSAWEKVMRLYRKVSEVDEAEDAFNDGYDAGYEESTKQEMQNLRDLCAGKRG